MIEMHVTVGKEPDSVQVDAAIPLNREMMARAKKLMDDEDARELEDMKNRIAAGMGIPKEFLEPTLTGHASILLAVDKEILKMTEETAKHADATIADMLAKKLKP